MDAPPHRLGLERAVEVYSGHDDAVGVTGSGHVIGTDLVLASAQVVAPGTPCQVRAPLSSRWAVASQVWRGQGAVLLRVTEPPWAGVPGIGDVRWARVAGERVPCVAMGFPRARQRGGFRDAEAVTGVAAAPTSPAAKTLTVRVSSPLWDGLSGAALVAEPAGQLVGVITDVDPRGPLHVVAVGALLADDRFRALAGVPPEPPEAVSEDDARVVLCGLLLPARERLPSDCPDWRLLLPRHAAVPYLGRNEQLATLRAWADEPAAVSVAVLTGRSGTGRTRLAAELCEELREAGWDAGFLPLDAVLEPYSGAVLEPYSGAVKLEALRPSLLVVESPEPSAPVVGELVRRLAKHGRNPRVRLLLVSREPAEAEWWRRLDTAAGGWLRRLNTTTVQLNQHPLTLDERTEHAFAAMKAFAPSRAALPTPPRLDDPEYGLPLRVHLAALLRLRGGEPELLPAPEPADPATLPGTALGTPPYRTAPAGTPPPYERAASAQGPARTQEETPAWNAFRRGGESRPGFAGWGAGPRGRPRGGETTTGEGLLRRFLARERDQWATVWPAGRERVDEATGRQAVALLTLTAPTPAELPGLLSAVPGLRTGGLRTAVVADWLGRIFPGDGRLCPLGPDLVAEQALAETEDLDALVLAIHDHERRSVAHLVRMLDVLRLCADREEVGRALRALVTSRIGTLVAEAAANPATRLADLLNAALALVPENDRAVAEAVAASPVRPGAPLGLRALEVTLGELAVRHSRRGGRRTAPAEALSGLSARLAAVGRVGEAVVAAAEAVEIFAAAPPYEEAAGQAEALFNLGACLLLAGEPGSALRPAQEAAARFRILAEDDPRHLARAARSHHNLACALLDTGRLTEAVEAFAAAGGDAAFAAALTAVLAMNTLSTDTTRPGVLPHVSLADERPRASTPDRLPAGDRAGMPPAGVVRRVAAPVAPLADLDPDMPAEMAACLAVAATAAVSDVAPTDRDLAHRLYLLAAWLGEHGRTSEALAPAAEAVVRLRGLAGEEPGLRLMHAEAAGLLARLHSELGDLDPAERYAAEAVRGLRALVALDPGEHRAALAVQLLDLGELLLTDSRPKDALTPLQDAAIVATALEEPRTLARARYLLGLCLGDLGRHLDSRAQLRGAAELYDRLSAEDAGYARHREEVRGASEEGVPPAGGDGEQPWMLSLVGLDPPRFRVAEGEDEPGRAHVHAAEQAAVGRALVGLGRHQEALPHLRGAVEAYGPGAESSFVVQQELAKLLVLEVVALERAGVLDEADAAAGRLAALYEGLVSERLESPVALAGALRLHAGIRRTRRNVEGALQSVTRALDILVPEPPERTRLLTATCLELSGLCHADLGEPGVAAAELAKGTALMAELDPVAPDLVGVHVLALARLARLRAAERGPSSATDLYAQILRVRPLPSADVLETVIREVSGHLHDIGGRRAARLTPQLTAFAEALEQEVPVSVAPEVHDRFGRCLAGGAPAVRAYKGLAAFDGRYRHALGLALARLDDADLAALEQAVDLLSDDGRALAGTLNRYAVELLEAGRALEALAHSERAADLCDELDDPGVAAVTYAQLGAALALLDRPQAALEAVTWSLAEQERAVAAGQAPPSEGHEGVDGVTDVGADGLLAVRAQAVQVRGQVLRASGRTQEALAHLVEATRLYVRLGRPQSAAEVAGTIADDLLAGGRSEEAVEYARIAATGHPPGTLKHALATQRLVRCHMMLGEAGEAGALAEELIRQARRSPGDLTYRAILADSLAQSSELLPMLRPDAAAEAEARAREAIAIYDELLTTGMNAEALHVSRAGAGLTLAAALRLRDLSAEAVPPLRESVAVLERHAPANPLLGGILSRAMLMLGDVLMESGRALEASLVFHRSTQVIDDELSSAVAHARLGFCQQELGQADAADTALRVAHGLLHDLLAGGRGAPDELTELLRDVLRGRLKLLEKSGRREEAAQVENELRAIRGA